MTFHKIAQIAIAKRPWFKLEVRGRVRDMAKHADYKSGVYSRTSREHIARNEQGEGYLHIPR